LPVHRKVSRTKDEERIRTMIERRQGTISSIKADRVDRGAPAARGGGGDRLIVMRCCNGQEKIWPTSLPAVLMSCVQLGSLHQLLVVTQKPKAKAKPRTNILVLLSFEKVQN